MATEKKSKKLKNEVVEPELCTICSDRYTATIRKKMTCKFCKESTCSKCIEQYLLTRHEDAHCLHCRVNYTDATLYEICTRTYLNQTYFKHRQEVLINREKANLPQLQDEAAQRMKVNRLAAERAEITKQISQKCEDIKKLKNKYNDKYAETYLRKLDSDEKRKRVEELEQITKERDKEQVVLEMLEEKYKNLRINQAGRNRNVNHEADESKDERRKFIRRCTRSGCQGYLSTAWKCGLCEWYSCNTCFMEKGEKHDSPHECKKEDIETAELIRKDCKPCPKCGEFIEKSSGCSQMFCISCQTPWDWNTGRIVTSGPIHNPHYYEMMKKMGGSLQRNPADVPCGGYPNWYQIQIRLGLNGYNVVEERTFREFHRICMEIQDNSVRNWRSHLDQTVTNQINIRYLTGELDEKTWGRTLATNEKKRKRDSEIQDVFAAFRMVAVELLNRVYQFQHAPIDPKRVTAKESHLIGELLRSVNKEAIEMIGIINDGLRTISISYSYSVPYIMMMKMESNQAYSGHYHLSLESRNFLEYERTERKTAKDAAQALNDLNEVNTVEYNEHVSDTESNVEVNRVEESDEEEDAFADNMTMSEQEQLQAAIHASYRSL